MYRWFSVTRQNEMTKGLVGDVGVGNKKKLIKIVLLMRYTNMAAMTSSDNDP